MFNYLLNNTISLIYCIFALKIDIHVCNCIFVDIYLCTLFAYVNHFTYLCKVKYHSITSHLYCLLWMKKNASIK